MDCGRVVNLKTGGSQIIGGVVMGIGMALEEETFYDPATGLPITRNLADYHVPVNADIREIGFYAAGEPDYAFNPMGAWHGRNRDYRSGGCGGERGVSRNWQADPGFADYVGQVDVMREIADIVHLYERHLAERFALATLVRATGSSYRRPGARMLISPSGETAGSLSGGCLEEEVAERAREVMRVGQPSLMTFDTRRRFGCHGVVEIFVERADARLLHRLAENVARERRRCCVATEFRGIDASGSRIVTAPEACPSSAFIQIIKPEIQLIIVGDGPDGAALHAFAQTLGWRVHTACQHRN